jgi:hypothetical protein
VWQVRLERSISVRQERNLKRWRTVLRAAIIRVRLDERYGMGIGEQERAVVANQAAAARMDADVELVEAGTAGGGSAGARGGGSVGGLGPSGAGAAPANAGLMH